MRAIKVEIDADSKAAKDLKLSYKGNEISAAVTKVNFYLTEDNTRTAIKALLKSSSIDDSWQRIDKEELYKAVDWLVKKNKRKMKK